VTAVYWVIGAALVILALTAGWRPPEPRNRPPGQDPSVGTAAIAKMQQDKIDRGEPV
jgi:hypothetical protein